jgi:2-keto-4-pentenoate hydratase/2-oxohepta-3-ene-1,7-dioic acid hydratase in catechol pathway
MKVASFETDSRQTYGVVQGDTVAEASGTWRDQYPDLRSVLAADALPDLASECSDSGLQIDDINFLPVLPNPDKIMCVGVNYRPHVEEMGRDVPKKPVVFVRFTGSLVGHRQPVIRPAVSEQYDYEGELAVVIGRPARHVKRTDAYDYIAGFTCFMDGSVRDWQRHTMQFTPGKNFYRSGSVGPYLVGLGEVPNVSNLAIETRVNGAVMQTGTLSELIFDIPFLIEYCSTFAELLPGDVIATGTPGGVGAARKPPVWLRNGDHVAVEIEQIGCLENPVCDE